MRAHTLFLKDIVDAMESIEKFVAGMDLEAFQADDKTLNAVLRKFEIIGEASKQIPDEIYATAIPRYLGRKWQPCEISSFMLTSV